MSRRRAGARRAALLAAALTLPLSLASCTARGDGAATSADAASPSASAGAASSPASPDPGEGTGTGAASSSTSPRSSASSASPAGRTGTGAYDGAERIEEVLRAELGEDAEVRVEDARAVRADLRQQARDIMGPLGEKGSPACEDARRAATTAAMEGLLGRTIAQVDEGSHGEVRRVTVISFTSDEARERVDARQTDARAACEDTSGPAQQASVLDLDAEAGTVAAFRQDAIAGYPDSSTDQLLRSGRASGGDVVLLELHRAGCRGCASAEKPPSLKAYAKKRVPEYRTLIGRLAG